MEQIAALPEGKVTEWMTPEKAAAELGKKPRRIRQMVDEGLLDGKKERNPETGHLVWLINAGSVARLQHNGANRKAATEVATLPQPIAQLPQPVAPSMSEQTGRPWLGLLEAARYSGLKSTTLKRDAAAGTIKAWNDGTQENPVWKFRRETLDALG
jgi:hypothetical protein